MQARCQRRCKWYDHLLPDDHSGTLLFALRKVVRACIAFDEGSHSMMLRWNHDEGLIRIGLIYEDLMFKLVSVSFFGAD